MLLNLQFSESSPDGNLIIKVLKLVPANGGSLQYWETRFYEPFLNFKAFDKLCKVFALSDFRKARLALGLKRAWTQANMNKILHDTPTLQAQKNLLKALQKPLELIAHYGATVSDSSKGRALRLVASKMASPDLQQHEIEDWFSVAASIRLAAEGAQLFVQDKIEKNRALNKREIKTFEGKLATDSLPKLCRKILGRDFQIQQCGAGEVKLTSEVKFVLGAAVCIGYTLIDSNLLSAIQRAKKAARK